MNINMYKALNFLKDNKGLRQVVTFKGFWLEVRCWYDFLVVSALDETSADLYRSGHLTKETTKDQLKEEILLAIREIEKKLDDQQTLITNAIFDLQEFEGAINAQ